MPALIRCYVGLSMPLIVLTVCFEYLISTYSSSIQYIPSASNFFLLLGTKYSVPRIAQAGDDVAVLIKSFIKIAAVYLNIRVRLGKKL